MGNKRAVNVEIKLKDVGGNQNRLIKRFMKKVKKEKILETARKNRHYEKPSSKRRRMKKRKLENARKAQREQNKKLNIQPLKR
jgi:ribosomal protein S21